MNYYERHLGDYARDTGHLTLLEHGVYTLLLDRYYVTEAPLPLDFKALHRLVRASSRAEKDALQTVLEEFFQQRDDGWHHKRCEQDIARFREKSEKAKRSAEARWSQRPEQCDGNANASGQNHADAMRTHCEGNAHQTPDTSKEQKQTPAPPARSPQDPPARPVTSTEAGRACLLLREAGCARVNPSHVDLLAALAEGVRPEAIRDTYLEHPNATNPFAWAISTARGRHAEGARPVPTGPPRQTQTLQSRTAQAMHNLDQVTAHVQRKQPRLDSPDAQGGPAETALPQPGRSALR